MDAAVEQALKSDRLIDITTIGRKSATPTTIEIVFHNFDGVIYITGTPGKRDWYANLVATPQFTFHLKQSTKADLSARAIPITDEATRRQVLAKVVEKWQQQEKLEDFVQSSPLVEVKFDDAQGGDDREVA
jgi:deazaflavin-dependent oxidoreductase (nitroreductase family)